MRHRRIPLQGGHARFLADLQTRDMTEVFAEVAAACPREKILVSNENLAKFLLRPSARDPHRLQAHDVVEAAAKFFRVRIVYFPRRQDYLSESHYFQAAKTWYCGSIEHYPRQQYDHDAALSQLEAVVGQENVRVLLYRDGMPNDSLAALFTAMGLTLPDQLSRDVGRQNVSLPRRKVLFLLAVPKNRRRQPGLINPPEMIRFILSTVEKTKAIADDGKRFISSPEARRALVAEYQPGNRALVARHGIADPGAFVALPDLDPSWTPPEPITGREIAAVFREAASAYWREKAPLNALGMSVRLLGLFTKTRSNRSRVSR